DLAIALPPSARRAGMRAVTHDNLAAQYREHRPARDGPALPRAVVGHVEVVLDERLAHAGIDEYEVGVAAGRDDALLGIEPEDPGRIGSRDVRRALERHAALDDALAVADAQTPLVPHVPARG